MRRDRPGYAASGWPAVALVACLASAACASRIDSSESREKWCGVGGGAAYGSTMPIVYGAALGSGDGRAMVYGAMLGILVAPVGTVIGAADGAINNPCPDEETKPGEPIHDDAPRQST